MPKVVGEYSGRMRALSVQFYNPLGGNTMNDDVSQDVSELSEMISTYKRREFLSNSMVALAGGVGASWVS